MNYQQFNLNLSTIKTTKTMSESKNLEFWNSVEKTNPNHTKNTKLGSMSITAIDPQYQRMNATSKFGMFGKGWGVKHSVYWVEEFLGTHLGNYKATFWYKQGEEMCEFDISSNVKVAYTSNAGRKIVDDEWMKKCSTDALTKGLSALGFNADVFMGKFDDNKYVSQMKEEFTEKKKLTPAIKKAMKEFWVKGEKSTVEERIKAYTYTDKDWNEITK